MIESVELIQKYPKKVNEIERFPKTVNKIGFPEKGNIYIGFIN